MLQKNSNIVKNSRTEQRPDSRNSDFKSASVNTEVITWAYTITWADPIVSSESLCALRLQSSGYLTDTTKISRQQSVFQPSSPSLELAVPCVIMEANSEEALKYKLTIYLFSLPGRGVLQFFFYLSSDSINVET